MMTLSATSLRTNYMMEQLRINAIDATLTKYREALHTYYSQGYDNGETTKLYKELINLGVDPDYLFDIDFDIREQHV